MKMKNYSVFMIVQATILKDDGVHYEKDFMTINTYATNKYNAVLNITRLSHDSLKFIRKETIKGTNLNDWKNVVSIEIVNIGDVTLIKD